MSVSPQSSPNTTRASLLLRLRQDGPAREVAWIEFYELYAPIICGFSRRNRASRDEAEDLVQEVLCAFFSVSPEFQYDPSRGRFRGYLKTCVWHKMTEIRRKHGREVRTIGPTASTDDETVEAVWNDVWETEKLHRALAAVHERYSINAERQRTFLAFEMCALLDRPTDEVAKEPGLGVEGVRAAKSRVSKALRQQFEELDDTTG